jgi:hypothetical protein
MSAGYHASQKLDPAYQILIGSNAYATQSNLAVVGSANSAAEHISLGLNIATMGDASCRSVLILPTDVAPVASQTDGIMFYSADFAAGNACPYFRTENGTIVGLNQSLLTTSGPTFDHLHVTNGADFHSDVLVVDAGNHRVGVNCAAPSAALHLSAAVGGSQLYLDGAADGSPAISFRQSDVEKAYIQYVDNGASADYLYVVTSNLYIMSGGALKVGIGCVDPAEVLDVTGNINVTGVYKVGDAQIAQANIAGLTTADGPTFDHVHLTSLEVSANAAIWTAQIANAHATGYGLLITAGTGAYSALYVRDKDSNTRFYVSGDGNVYMPSIPAGAGIYPVKHGAGGVITADTSDKRMKHNITPCPYGLEALLKLSPILFSGKNAKMRDDKSGFDEFGEEHQCLGLAAQDVYGIIPECAFRPADEKAEFWTVHYDRLVPVLIRALQEMSAKVDRLELKLPPPP